MRIRPVIFNISLAAGVLLSVVMVLVIANLSRIINEQHARLISMNDSHEVLSMEDNLARLRREALTRTVLYDELIKRDMLLDGMVVNLNASRRPEGECDSLLFSSLRYYALASMGLKERATEAWASIKASRDGAQWLRHPRCSKSLSRDMIMGVLVALKANPENGTVLFRTMLSEIDRRGGFVGDGPFYVSWLSPGIAGLLRMEAERRHVPFEEWPWILKQSFSSIEYDAMFLQEGYVSHLAALDLWLEIKHSKSREGFNPRSFFGAIERLVTLEKSLDTSLDVQRRQWISGRLRALHPENIFYRWLDHETFGTLTNQNQEHLLADLLSMSQFPMTRLPMNCDRRADYLWQRRHAEFSGGTDLCTRTFSGVDFLWMASLLGAGTDEQDRQDISDGGVPVAH